MTDNELIAEFMGDQQWFFKDPKRQPGDEVTYLKYERSWDWLIPVVEKIEVELCKYSSSHFAEIFNGTVNTDINVTYPVVIEAINWINKQKP